MLKDLSERLHNVQWDVVEFFHCLLAVDIAGLRSGGLGGTVPRGARLARQSGVGAPLTQVTVGPPGPGEYEHELEYSYE